MPGFWQCQVCRNQRWMAAVRAHCEQYKLVCEALYALQEFAARQRWWKARYGIDIHESRHDIYFDHELCEVYYDDFDDYDVLGDIYLPFVPRFHSR